VSADIARQNAVTGTDDRDLGRAAALTMIAALTYGELAAAMPHAAGSMCICARRSDPERVPVRVDDVSGHPDGNDRGCGGRFRQVYGRLCALDFGRDYLVGQGKIGVTTQQALAIAVIALLSWVNSRGIRTGAAIQNVFTFAKTGRAGPGGARVLIGRNPDAVAITSTASGAMRAGASIRYG